MNNKIAKFIEDIKGNKKSELKEIEKSKSILLERLTDRGSYSTSPIDGESPVLRGGEVSCWMGVGKEGKKSLLSVTGKVTSFGRGLNEETIDQYYEVLLNNGKDKEGNTDYSYHKITNVVESEKGITFDDTSVVFDSTRGKDVVAIHSINSQHFVMGKALDLVEIMSSVEAYALKKKNEVVIHARAFREKMDIMDNPSMGR